MGAGSAKGLLTELNALQPAEIAERAAEIVKQREDAKQLQEKLTRLGGGEVERKLAERHEAREEIPDALLHSDPIVRRAAVRALGRLAPEALEQFAPLLVERHEDADPEVRMAAWEELRKLEPAAFDRHAGGAVHLPVVQRGRQPWHQKGWQDSASKNRSRKNRSETKSNLRTTVFGFDEKYPAKTSATPFERSGRADFRSEAPRVMSSAALLRPVSRFRRRPSYIDACEASGVEPDEKFLHESLSDLSAEMREAALQQRAQQQKAKDQPQQNVRLPTLKNNKK